MIEDLNKSLSEYLKLLRFKQKKSQEETAMLLNISRNTYTIWENNPIALSLENILKIGKVLDEDIIIFFKEYVAKSNDKNKN